jgi:hypothetical protein
MRSIYTDDEMRGAGVVNKIRRPTRHPSSGGDRDGACPPHLQYNIKGVRLAPSGARRHILHRQTSRQAELGPIAKAKAHRTGLGESAPPPYKGHAIPPHTPTGS